MLTLPDPVWPVIALALLTAIDAVLCLKPAAFIAACFEAVRWPRRLWWTMPIIKLAAVAGLVAGIWVPYLGATTSLALVLYFLLAVAAHLRAHDLGRNLFANASGMLLICIAVTVFCFLR